MKIKILNGSTSIRGNFVRIEDGDRTMIFDQGIRFDLMSRYYSGFIAPRGVAELRSIGAIPRPEWYMGASAIYISHMHLDHLGALSNIPFETKVKLPSMAVYEDMGKMGRFANMAFSYTKKILCRTRGNKTFSDR